MVRTAWRATCLPLPPPAEPTCTAHHVPAGIHQALLHVAREPARHRSGSRRRDVSGADASRVAIRLAKPQSSPARRPVALPANRPVGARDAKEPLKGNRTRPSPAATLGASPSSAAQSATGGRTASSRLVQHGQLIGAEPCSAGSSSCPREYVEVDGLSRVVCIDWPRCEGYLEQPAWA